MVQAARYQIMIMFLIAATTCIAVVGAVYLAVLNIMDRQHRLCSEKILPKASTGSGVEHWIKGQTIKVFSSIVAQNVIFASPFPTSRKKMILTVLPTQQQIAQPNAAHQECHACSCRFEESAHSNACWHMSASKPCHSCYRLPRHDQCNSLSSTLKTIKVDWCAAGVQVSEQGDQTCDWTHQGLLWTEGALVLSLSRDCFWSPCNEAKQKHAPSG